jgi:large subunit ribosomal protein L9
VKLLLRSDVQGVGKKGDIVDVADGFGRNYLLPKGFAVTASPGVESQAAAMRRSRDLKDAADRSAAEEIAKTLVPKVVTIAARASGEGKLFGSVGASEIVDAVRDQTGIELERRHLVLEEPIKTTGSHAVPARLHNDVQFQITVEVGAA